MVNREKGWDLGGSRTDVWRSYADQHGTLRYVGPNLLMKMWLY